PSCWSAYRLRSSRRTGGARRAARSRNVRRRNAASTSASSRPRSRQARKSSTSASRCAPTRSSCRRWGGESLCRPARYLDRRKMHRPPPPGGRCGGQAIPSRRERFARSIPFERSLLPFIDKSDGQNRKEYHHRPESQGTELAECNGPRKQECYFEIENDENDC